MDCRARIGSSGNYRCDSYTVDFAPKKAAKCAETTKRGSVDLTIVCCAASIISAVRDDGAFSSTVGNAVKSIKIVYFFNLKIPFHQVRLSLFGKY